MKYDKQRFALLTLEHLGGVLVNCPYCMGQLYPNRDGTFTCHCCGHYDIDREEVKEDQE